MKKLKKLAINKKKLREIYKNPDSVKDSEIFTCVSLPNGSCLLSLEKKKNTGEFYSNPEFNKALRRRFNIKPEQFVFLYNGYLNFKKLFKNKKTMRKYIQTMRRKENELQRQQVLKGQDAITDSSSSENS